MRDKQTLRPGYVVDTCSTATDVDGMPIMTADEFAAYVFETSYLPWMLLNHNEQKGA